ncbi:striatin-3 isoform X1 [Sabethes cyaneus]|uniref:striatin-3 isoform X1 n=1 Tax=Sabethes cyaneus TaxID=53552 RepID=UPI00237D58ED|nr:striatin-3 isoform X1 [Sabethes cyaneus]XP_053694561.1 striatin-3 isoform X1 [Sabethes cyaneus]XP_053694562.1 striatin-3 isoform X1 [Sabethes cyaneus]XP_053694563.1 striatin-3 isoform X1 [Sabethes cyaneus]XP_053694564.1 striatin-3 isoform X1 [Sabethes cyaneus]XP_053694565.1 striatin-3 isoform X1 [Sabethes cyaneus]XP_053694566.1 striatin-3 isoform X1 [Sabethes cyaneus]XP_053694567.1 striatin-3 isoform X1 [Sabethes cyaneus]XP_053694568.1 striatin-3 isoform X1 [Sabethes cyaneus]XP_05369457
MRINRIEDRMDENSSLNHQNGAGGQLSGIGGTGAGGMQSGGVGLGGMVNNSASGMNNNNKPVGLGGTGGGGSGQDDQNNKAAPTQYSIPGILHFIQHEWARFELERSQWDVDRAELQAKIAVLLGERKGQESLKSDLIRRIKMLEYALKQERAKFHRLKYGVDPPMNDIKPPSDEPGIGTEVAPDPEVPYSSVSNITWRQGRQLLRQYLQEIGYTETILDIRSTRVRSLLGLNNNSEQEENVNPNINGGTENNKRASESQGRRTPAKKSQPSSMTEAMIMDSEAAVIANFEFLAQADAEMSDEDDLSDELGGENEETDMKTTKRKAKGVTMNEDDVDAEADEVINELNLLTEGEDNNLTESRKIDGGDLFVGYNKPAIPRHPSIPGITNDEEVDSSLGLGELAQLTVNNEAESTYEVSNAKEPYRKTWNAKYTLRSHFDGVRALAFHPQEPVLITASEDHTLKLWNLQKTVPAKKSASLDVEPLYTFRSHNGPVLCLAMSATGEQCYSGGLDGAINCWNLPNSNIDPYDSYDPEVMKCTLDGHTNAVWGLAVNHTKNSLVSCSADGTVKLWSPSGKIPQLNTTFTSETEGTPTSVDFVRDQTDRIVVAYSSTHCIIYDTETGRQVVKLEASQEMTGNVGKHINKVVSHPTLPITITAHEDRHIRFWDNTTGSLIHSMVAHLDAVTSLAIDAHGLYLLSGSHDCSIRLWHMDNKTCVQEITAHRKKFDESILDVAFHPSKPYIASAGADAIAKVFV